MGTIRTYFRNHKWQRRMLAATISLLVGAAGALLAYPYVSDWMLLRDLDNPNAGYRQKAILIAEGAARNVPRTRRALIGALDTASDRQFLAVAVALDRAGYLRVEGRDPRVLDRFRALEMGTASDGHVRRLLLVETLGADRDNPHVRRLLAAAVADPDPAVRRTAASLAARLADDDALGRLLADQDPSVLAEAALSAGLAGRKPLAERLETLARGGGDVHVVSSAALGLARLDPPAAAAVVAELLAKHSGPSAQADPPPAPASAPASAPAAPTSAPATAPAPPWFAQADLQERLLHVAAGLDQPRCRQAVLGVLEASRKAGRLPPAMALRAAEALRLTEARQDVQRTLDSLTGDRPPLQSQLLAALAAAQRTGVPVRQAAYDVCLRGWGPSTPFASLYAARALGRDLAAKKPPGQTPTPADQECIALLRQRAVYAVAFPGEKPDSARRIVTTPMPSAAAAVALWRQGPDDPANQLFVRDAATTGRAPAQYVAWHAARLAPEAAFKLGRRMLPELASEHPVYNEHERACGAMLLALSARTPAQRRAAAERIQHRLDGGALGGESSVHAAATYRCALLMLGRNEYLAEVRTLLGIWEIPRNRVVLALCGAGLRDGLDWMLANAYVSLDLIVLLYLNRDLGDMLAVMVPELPGIDVCASQDLRRWQAMILRDYYRIHRATIHPELAR